jgi:hypothetical protein
MVVHHVVAACRDAITPVAHGCSTGRRDAIVESWRYKGNEVPYLFSYWSCMSWASSHAFALFYFAAGDTPAVSI